MSDVSSVIDQQLFVTGENLRESGFFESGLEDLNLPAVQNVNGTPYIVMGDPGAENLVFCHTPYSTRVTDDSIKVRLEAQQRALGDDYCVVGATAYDPFMSGARMSKQDAKAVSEGSFLPFARRTLDVIGAVRCEEDQIISMYGFSMGADVAVELTHATLTNENYGVVTIDNLGVVEPARVKNRGRLGIMLTFATSGGDLFENVLNSGSPALLEARGIDIGIYPDEHDLRMAEKAHDKAVQSGVVDYTFADLRGILSLIKGFGHTTTIEQLLAIEQKQDGPSTVLGRAAQSKLFPVEAFEGINESASLKRLVIDGDHSIADDVVYGAAVLRCAIDAE